MGRYSPPTLTGTELRRGESVALIALASMAEQKLITSRGAHPKFLIGYFAARIIHGPSVTHSLLQRFPAGIFESLPHPDPVENPAEEP